ncbi:MAG TPA: GNAT family N-acetyltransferase, partial [Terriglobales bacterium]|nr:GNAT family N-acetyltransferase [Terriglobales bacterium]
RERAHLLLTEMESKQILSSYGIASAECRHAANAEAAVVVAQEIGFPVVLKLHSATVTHKSRAGGVRINLVDAKAVREAFEAIRDVITRNTGQKSFEGVTVQPVVQSGGIEIILGSSLDAQFGPVLMAGTGGTMAEAISDYSIGLPPLNTTLARRMVESTRIFRVVKAAYGEEGCQLLEGALVKLSRLVIDNPCIREVDINPLVMSPRQITALDARIVLYDAKIPEDRLPRPAIRPYPAQYTTNFTLRNGTATTVRPIMPHDEPLMVQFHGTLSDHSVYMRYFQVSSLRQRVAHERLARQCFIDYDREMALVAVTFGPEGRKIVGVGRLIKLHGRNQAEVALLISDKYQRQGLGTQFLKMLTQVGRDENLECITAYMQPVNLSMQALVTKNGFVFEKHPDQDTIIAKLDLGIPGRSLRR